MEEFESFSDEEESVESDEKNQRKRIKKDKNEVPKKPPTSYMLISKEQETGLVKKIGLWHAMKDEERKSYHDKAAKLKKEYELVKAKTSKKRKEEEEESSAEEESY
ncbi:hypothetical protein C9374_003608 [Naegleria lovaniensis]|uniref:HMG box domain-containing protein n=1 Tax=Naegleria lovaniensis TaxID=51637 RepID=A0AA88H5H3_NAELO|nr:uncharacterized protein C9374_003608 [Naegleria lovaniensis]KAG2393844.1 hypothetical protein C9374_003608 [Naegleria lovaniensis]